MWHFRRDQVFGEVDNTMALKHGRSSFIGAEASNKKSLLYFHFFIICNVFFWFVVPFGASAANSKDGDVSTAAKSDTFLLEVPIDFNTKDIAIGLELKYRLPYISHLYGGIGFSCRPFALTTFEHSGDYLVQKKINSYHVPLLLLEKQQPLAGAFGVFVTGAVAGVYEDVRGLRSGDSYTFIPLGRLGLIYKASMLVFRAGYEYFPLDHVPANRLYLSVGVRL